MARRAAQPTANYLTRPTGFDPHGEPGSRGRSSGRPSDRYGRPSPPSRRIIDYPRQGRVGWRRWIPSWKLVGGLIGLGFAASLVAFFAAYQATAIPTPDEMVDAQTSIVYDAKGVELGRLAAQNRHSVKLAQVPPDVQHAVLAAEDRTFYSNSGISPTSIIRAAWSDARGSSLQGGSTITQQYVKNVYDMRERTLTRKAKEFFIAMKISRQMSKDDLLEDYLNTIYLGRGSYGFDAAAQAYFGKPVSQLDVTQGAFLAGIINGPNLYDPRKSTEAAARAQVRWNYVLDGMVAEGWLAPAKRAQLKFPAVLPPKKGQSLDGAKGYLITMAVEEAEEKLGISESELETGGFKIQTTFDYNLVKQARKSVKDVLPSDSPKGLQVGMAAIDPMTGAVKAIYGGDNYLTRNRNAATQDRAQAGSTFKPFALLAALEDGVNLKSRFDGHSPQRFEGYKVTNFGNEQFGDIDLLRATANSVNTVYVGLNDQIGPDRTYEAAVKAGIPKGTPGLTKTLSNVLGPSAPHPIDMAAAYGTIASGGVHHEPYVVQSIVRMGDGKQFWNAAAHISKTQTFDPEVIADAEYAMQGVVKRGTGTYARNLDRPAAGKTGTSQDSLSAWFVGFTPQQLVTSVAMYQIGPNGEAVKMKGFGQFSSITGGGYPVRIWTDFMDAALKGKKETQFPDPSWGGEAENEAPAVTATSQPTEQPTSGPTTQPSTEPTRTRTTRPSKTKLSSSPAFTITP